MVDHIEDGGRAAVADEAIAWAVFCHARTRGWYEGNAPDLALLDYVREMTYALEVSARSREEWAHAIRTGLRCLQAVWLHGGGILHGGPVPGSISAWPLTIQAPVSLPSAPLGFRPAWAGVRCWS